MKDRHPPVGQPQAAGKGSTHCAPATNPPIQRWVIWNGADQDWDVSGNPSPNAGKKKPIILPEESGGHEIRFHLKVPPGSTWQFDTNDPIWTADNAKCGTLSSRASDQVSIVDAQPLLLRIFDENDGESRLIRYQLNFVDSGVGAAPPACDPTILNGGNGQA